jgi:tetratricopeptide (TPR) repeat protein
MADQDHTAPNVRGARRKAPTRAKGLRPAFSILRLGFAIVRLGLMLSAAFAIVRLASAEIDFNRDTISSVRQAAQIGNSEYWMRLAELDPAHAPHLLREAALADPRDASVWIALGLVEERLTQERLAAERSAKKRDARNRESQAGDFTEARAAFDKAFSLDRQYSPAWALANFCLRHQDQGQEEEACFWRAAARAALRSPSLADLAIADSGGSHTGASANLTDLAPLLDLAGRMEPSPAKTLDRLTASINRFAAVDGATATYAQSIGRELERAWLNDLIGQERWEDAALIAQRIESRHDSADKARLDDLVDRLIAAGKAPEAVTTWNGYAAGTAASGNGTFAPLVPFKGASLTNGDFASEPTDMGFDWRLGLHPAGAFGSVLSGASGNDARQIAKRWQPNTLEFRLSGEEPEQVPMSEQWLPLARGTYRLRFEYSTRGLAAPTGIRWDFAARAGNEHTENQAEEKDRHAEADSLAPSEKWRAGEWIFSNTHGARPLTLGRLRLIYSREPGTERARGLFSLRKVTLETL